MNESTQTQSQPVDKEAIWQVCTTTGIKFLCEEHRNSIPASNIIQLRNSGMQYAICCDICGRQSAVSIESYALQQAPMVSNIITRLTGNKVVYLSGPMTGLPNHNKPAFWKMERVLMRIGIHVLNPANHEHGLAYEEYMMRDIRWVLECNGMICLKGWEKSAGATVEHRVAKITGKPIWNEIIV